MDINDLKEILESISELHKATEKFVNKMSRGPASFYFDKLGELVEGLAGYAKFKRGDRVQLAHDIDCGGAPGWLGCAHFLKEGAAATVREIYFGKNKFGYSVVFDVETFISPTTGKTLPVTTKHMFWLKESDLAPERPA